MQPPIIDPQDQSAVNAILLDRTERIQMALFGNGDPTAGLIGIVAAHGEAVEALQAEFEERAPTKREKYAALEARVSALERGRV